MNVSVCSDHRGFHAKELIKAYLKAAGHAVVDLGCDAATSCDYPDFAIAGAISVASGKSDRGIFLSSGGGGTNRARITVQCGEFTNSPRHHPSHRRSVLRATPVARCA